MLVKGLIAALILTSTPQVEADPPISIEMIHDLNGDLETQAHVWKEELGQPQIFSA